MFVFRSIFLSDAATLLAQVDPIRQTTIAFSGPQFFTALVAGLFLTFGFQMLLTNFSVAAGMSVLSLSAHDHKSERSSSSGSTINTIGTAVGIWTLVTVSIALFFACLLAVKLSLVSSSVLGATVGLAIWAAYFSILIWISSTTVGSLVGSVVNTATRGFQAVFGTATAALGAKAASSELVSSAEAVAAAVRREMTAYIDPQDVKASFQDLVGKVKSPELDVKGLRAEFEKMLKDSELNKVVDKDHLPTLSRDTFESLLKERTDLSPRDVKKIVDELDRSWQGTMGGLKPGGKIGQMLDLVKSAKPQDLLSGGFAQQLDQMTKELGHGENSSQFEQIAGTLMGIILGRVDLSDLDVEKIKGQIKTAGSTIQTQAEKVVDKTPPLSPGASAIRSDVEHYLRDTYSWQLTPDRIEQEFRDRLYDPNANARTIRQSLEALAPAEFSAILQSRGVFTQAQIADITGSLDRVRQQVLAQVRATESAGMLANMQAQIDRYFQSTPKEQLLAPAASTEFKALLIDADADPQELHERLSQLQQRPLTSLQQRADLTPAEKSQIAQTLNPILTVAIADTEGLQQGIKTRVSTQWEQVRDYLRNTGKDELNPESIERDFQKLLDDPQGGLHDIKHRANSFDRDTLVQLLSQRKDLNPDQVNNILDRVESNWKKVTHTPAAIADKAKAQYEDTTSAIADYLRRTGKSELNPDGIKRDLTTLLQDPKMGVESIRDRLSQIDRDTLVQMLRQRDDLTEAEANAAIDRVQDTIRQVLRTPQRLAMRAKSKVTDFQTTLEDYLRNTNKQELNPEAIERELSLLLKDPRLGLEQLSDRLAHVDRATVIALLSQRQDISEAEAAQIVDRVLAVRDRFNHQLEAIKAKMQSVIDGILGKVRDYLNALERPELNYDGIKTDVQQLFDDPNAGFDALRDRLSHFDRDTLVAVISSRDDISQADANRLIDRVEQVRTDLLRRAERIQTQIQSRLDDLKSQAQAQAEATRKAAATAAWWLFATAFTSGIAAATAGSIAVTPMISIG
ncbi:MFS transporter [Chamaesiphon sp. VAR_48_metabat_403]|uniref:MFS transporter n=1 Tax=Chamaesiphon sp. VAR_48_metabat_403 TaxID=2964700 RepID=UPI00286EA311|nr:MFS transporter [Chamaesiphon sp. VAR_48_metabat_403]